MKILFVQPTADKQGHYGKYTLNLCQELVRQGNEVTLFTNKAEPARFLKNEPLFKIAEYKGGTLSFTKFDEARTTKPWLYFWGYLRNSFIIFKAALDFAKRERPDVIQVTDVEFGIVSLLLWLKAKNLPPLVLLSHAANFSFAKYPGNIIFRLYKVFQREVLRTRLGREIKAIVTLGEYHKEELQKQFRLKPGFIPIKVIYDGAEPPALYLSKEEARQKLGIAYGGTIFLLFGILRKDKGIEHLLESAFLLKNDDFKILIAGSPFDYDPKEISDMVMRLGLEDRVILRLGYIPDEEIPLYFFAADCVVFPYKKTYAGGTGPLLKEAAMHKKPVIVSRVSEMGRLVAEKQMGLVGEPENSIDLAENMREFLRVSHETRQQWGENAFNTANTWEKMAKQYIELYEQVCSSN